MGGVRADRRTHRRATANALDRRSSHDLRGADLPQILYKMAENML
jgi:hypothetical protein